MRKSNAIEGKTRQQKLDYLKSLRYPILLRQKKDKFYLIIPELCLVAVSDNLEDAYKDLYGQKQNFIAKILDCEAEDEITLPRKTHEFHETFHQLKMFTYKLLIVCLLGGVTLTISGALISNKIANISGVGIVKKVVKSIIIEAEKFATNTPENIKQERLEKVHQFVMALQPVAYELRTLFSPPSREEEVEDKP